MPRLTGKNGAFFIIGIGKIADVFDWTYDSSQEMFECTAKGETFQRIRPGAVKATVNVKRYIQTAGSLTELLATNAGLPIQFELYLNLTAPTVGDTSKAYVTGQGYLSRGSLSGPHDKATDELELTVDGTANGPVVF